MSQSAHGKSAVGAVKDGLGFGIIRSPPIFCLGTNADATFYSLILPIIAILMVGLVMLITVFWIIHKVSTYSGGNTVELPNNGHIGSGPFVLYIEVVPL